MRLLPPLMSLVEPLQGPRNFQRKKKIEKIERGNMGRGKIEIKLIENHTNRQVTYSKRRNGIFKKAQELTVLCDARVSLIMLSNTGKMHEYISPTTTTKNMYDDYQKTLGVDLWSSHYQAMKDTLWKLKEINNKLRREIRQRVGHDLNGLTYDQLRSLEDKMASSLEAIRERKYHVLKTQTETCKKKVKNLQERRGNMLHGYEVASEDPQYGYVDNEGEYESAVALANGASNLFTIHLHQDIRDHANLHHHGGSSLGSSITHLHDLRWVMKIFVRVYLPSERWLSDQIFGELGPVYLDCFVEASKPSMLQLMNFGEAMSIGPHQPEKLFRILDMYEVLVDLLPDIDGLYVDEAGSSVRIECHEVLMRLGDSVKATFSEFENAIASNTSTNPVAGGGLHPLTRYVMNYLRTLTDYGETLNVLLDDCDEGDSISLSPDMSPTTEEENKSTDTLGRISPMLRHYRSLVSTLECNLEDKSKLYKDASLQHIFLMNNLHYMAQKVKGDELRLLFGDGWIRKCNGKFQQHAMNYQRASWSSILSLLKEEGIQNPGSNSISKTLLKERLRSFYLAFEEIYKSQTTWLIPDPQLREDVQISTSLNVVQAYRTFVGRHSNDISDKLIKYSADDLQNYLLDLFEGSSKSLQNSSRR